jgi:hypothetical protein
VRERHLPPREVVSPLLELRVSISCAFYYCLYRITRRFSRARDMQIEAVAREVVQPADPQAQEQPGPERSAPSAGELLTLKQWAFDYERLLLESDLPARERDRLIRLVSREVVPLIGQVRICDLDDELVRSVGHVLAVRAGGGDARYVARAWAHFVGWVRYHAAPEERRNIWTLLDPGVLRLHDEVMGD